MFIRLFLTWSKGDGLRFLPEMKCVAVNHSIFSKIALKKIEKVRFRWAVFISTGG